MGRRPRQTQRVNHRGVGLSLPVEPTSTPARTCMRPLPPRPARVIRRHHQHPEPAGGSNNISSNYNTILLSEAVTEPPSIPPPPPSIRPLLNNNSGPPPVYSEDKDDGGHGEMSVLFDDGIDWNSVERDFFDNSRIPKVKDRFSSVEDVVEEFIKEGLL